MPEDFELQLELHKQRLEFVENELMKHSADDATKFSELKLLLVKIHDSAAGERKEMFKIFDQRLLELKSDFKDQYQTKAAAESLKSKTIWSIVGGFFSLGTLIVVIVGLFIK